jgi:hypothetical protein
MLLLEMYIVRNLKVIILKNTLIICLKVQAYINLKTGYILYSRQISIKEIEKCVDLNKEKNQQSSL